MYPIYEILITALGWTERENLPLISVIVPLEGFPFSKTVAPIIGSPTASVSVPAVSYTHLTLPTILRV